MDGVSLLVFDDIDPAFVPGLPVLQVRWRTKMVLQPIGHLDKQDGRNDSVVAVVVKHKNNPKEEYFDSGYDSRVQRH